LLNKFFSMVFARCIIILVLKNGLIGVLMYKPAILTFKVRRKKVKNGLDFVLILLNSIGQNPCQKKIERIYKHEKKFYFKKV